MSLVLLEKVYDLSVEERDELYQDHWKVLCDVYFVHKYSIYKKKLSDEIHVIFYENLHNWVFMVSLLCLIHSVKACYSSSINLLFILKYKRTKFTHIHF